MKPSSLSAPMTITDTLAIPDPMSCTSLGWERTAIMAAALEHPDSIRPDLFVTASNDQLDPTAQNPFRTPNLGNPNKHTLGILAAGARKPPKPNFDQPSVENTPSQVPAGPSSVFPPAFAQASTPDFAEPLAEVEALLAEAMGILKIAANIVPFGHIAMQEPPALARASRILECVQKELPHQKPHQFFQETAKFTLLSIQCADALAHCGQINAAMDRFANAFAGWNTLRPFRFPALDTEGFCTKLLNLSVRLQNQMQNKEASRVFCAYMQTQFHQIKDHLIAKRDFVEIARRLNSIKLSSCLRLVPEQSLERALLNHHEGLFYFLTAQVPHKGKTLLTARCCFERALAQYPPASGSDKTMTLLALASTNATEGHFVTSREQIAKAEQALDKKDTHYPFALAQVVKTCQHLFVMSGFEQDYDRMAELYDKASVFFENQDANAPQRRLLATYLLPATQLLVDDKDLRTGLRLLQKARLQLEQADFVTAITSLEVAGKNLKTFAVKSQTGIIDRFLCHRLAEAEIQIAKIFVATASRAEPDSCLVAACEWMEQISSSVENLDYPVNTVAPVLTELKNIWNMLLGPSPEGSNPLIVTHTLATVETITSTMAGVFVRKNVEGFLGVQQATAIINEHFEFMLANLPAQSMGRALLETALAKYRASIDNDLDLSAEHLHNAGLALPKGAEREMPAIIIALDSAQLALRTKEWSLVEDCCEKALRLARLNPVHLLETTIAAAETYATLWSLANEQRYKNTCYQTARQLLDEATELKGEPSQCNVADVQWIEIARINALLEQRTVDKANRRPSMHRAANQDFD